MPKWKEDGKDEKKKDWTLYVSAAECGRKNHWQDFFLFLVVVVVVVDASKNEDGTAKEMKDNTTNTTSHTHFRRSHILTMFPAAE